jgi:hypothetical protein
MGLRTREAPKRSYQSGGIKFAAKPIGLRAANRRKLESTRGSAHVTFIESGGDYLAEINLRLKAKFRRLGISN